MPASRQKKFQLSSPEIGRTRLARIKKAVVKCRAKEEAEKKRREEDEIKKKLEEEKRKQEEQKQMEQEEEPEHKDLMPEKRLEILESKLEDLREQKHKLFNILKQILNEDEKKRQEELEEKRRQEAIRQAEQQVQPSSTTPTPLSPSFPNTPNFTSSMQPTYPSSRSTSPSPSVSPSPSPYPFLSANAPNQEMNQPHAIRPVASQLLNNPNTHKNPAYYGGASSTHTPPISPRPPPSNYSSTVITRKPTPNPPSHFFQRGNIGPPFPPFLPHFSPNPYSNTPPPMHFMPPFRAMQLNPYGRNPLPGANPRMPPHRNHPRPGGYY